MARAGPAPGTGATVSPGARRRPPIRSALNDLTGTEWIRFTRSWFVANPPPRRPEERSHPAKFPEAVCAEFIRFFTRPGMWVLDPFAGTGSTLVAARRLGRSAVGLELDPEFARLARGRLARTEPPPGATVQGRVLRADARGLPEIWEREGLPRMQLVLTSPPYWDMLTKPRGGVVSVHRERHEAGLRTAYSGGRGDLGAIREYDRFIDEVVAVLRRAGDRLDPGRYLVVVLQNLRDPEGRIRRLAWDVTERLDGGALRFQGERIWCQDAKRLGIWGYPSTFVPNYHHHYCLIFRRAGALVRGSSPTRTGGTTRGVGGAGPSPINRRSARRTPGASRPPT